MLQQRYEAVPYNYTAMDEITEIFNTRTVSDIISGLKNKSINVPEWSKLLKDYEPSKHKIVDDKIGRKDKTRSDGSVDPASRIYLGLERLLVKRVTEFAFAIPVRRIYHNTEDNETRQKIAKAIEAIYKYARIDSENTKRGNAYFASCEIFTIWYAVKKPNTLYGFKSEYKLKCKTYSPMDGVDLYPLFDELGDMIAMSFEYKKKINNKEVTFFETYTANKHYKWKQENGDWESVIAPEKIAFHLGKIPGAYTFRPEPVYYGLSHIREEIEYTLSRNSDVIAYNSAPVLKVTGELVGEEDKGETRRLFRLKNGGDVAYVSWTQAIEALKYHVETLLKLFFMQAQMPDLSFENMKSLGNIGFDARQMMLSDAHLKIGDESGAWIEFFERECNVIKEFLKMMNTEWKSEIDNIEVEHVITPFIQNDEDALINRCIKGNGGKAIFSQLESIRIAGYSNDPEETLKQIQEEDKATQQTRVNSLFEGAE